jgi:hypothetical protein
LVCGELFAQQPWPGAGNNSGGGTGQPSASNREETASQNRQDAARLRPVPPVPPPPPPPPVNPVFPRQGEQDGAARNSENQPAAQQRALSPDAGGNQVTENMLLTATEVYPGGNRNVSVADTISHIFYTVYSDQSRSFTITFKSGEPYTYYLRNPRGIVQMGPDLLRVTYDTIIQAGTRLVTGFFFSEVSYSNGKPGSLTVVNSSSGAAVVVMSLREAQP